MTQEKWHGYFNDQTQKHLVAYLLRDTHTLILLRPFLVPEHFSNHALRGLVMIATQFFDKYRTAPDEEAITYINKMVKSGMLPENRASLLLDLCRELLQERLYNRDFIIDEYDQLLKHISFEPALLSAAELAKKGRFDDAEMAIKEAMQNTPRGKIHLGTPFAKDPTAYLQKLATENSDIFFTLIPPLDHRRLYIRRGELGMIQGQKSSIGKSIALLYLARNLIFQGKRVLIYTMELSEDLYCGRMYMCVGGLTSTELPNSPVLVDRLNRMVRNDDMLFIKQFPCYTTTVSQLTDHMQMLEDVRKFRPDVVMVDYADLLSPGINALQGDLYGSGLAIFSQLRAVAMEKNIGIWTVSQSGRGAGDQASATASTIGGSIAKIQISDLVFSINRSDEDEVKGRIRIMPLKVRNASFTAEFDIPCDLARMQFYDSSRVHDISLPVSQRVELPDEALT